MLIYLARPNDHANGSDEVAFGVACAARTLRNQELAWYDPIAPFGSPMADPIGCYRVNEAALRESDACLAIYPPGVPSTGTPMEIMRAHESGKPTAVVGGNGSMQLLGMGVRQFDWDGTAGPVDAAIDWLKTVSATRYASTFQIKYVGDQQFEPKCAVPGDAGFDLICSKETRVHIDQFVDIPCGVSIELPYDCWGMIVGRSSTLRRRRLLVNQGIIDQGYRGPLFAGVWNLGEEVAIVEEGERIAQLIPMPLTSMMLSVVRVAELTPSLRGTKAFGSTGK